jgi:crossover junction endodeoxyribonuclease RusA
MIQLSVPGVPVPKGSLKHVGRGRLVEQTNVKPWMSRIRAAALRHVFGMELPVIDAACRVSLTFWFPRPASAKNRLYPHLRSTGDLDKLVRAVLDALQPSGHTPGILADDSLVVQLRAGKEYVEEGVPRVEITIEEL